VLLSVVIAAVVVVQDRDKIHLRSAGWLLLASLPGLPLGLLLLAAGHPSLVRGALGAVILAFSVWSLTARRPPELHSEGRGWLAACGFCAGVLGGAYGMNGPPLVLYGSMRRWPAPQFRATLQAYFLPASLLGLIGYWFAGLLTAAVTRDFLVSLPAMVPAVFLGRAINHRLRGDFFLKLLFMGLAVIGAVLLVESMGKGV
jgi:uncharacterized membrane protein YfcA